MRVNYLGVIYTLDAVLPGMLERRSGRIVALVSMTAVRGVPFEAAYGASKAALTTFLESLRPALRPRGILVTLAYPGFVETPLLDGSDPARHGPAARRDRRRDGRPRDPRRRLVAATGSSASPGA